MHAHVPATRIKCQDPAAAAASDWPAAPAVQHAGSPRVSACPMCHDALSVRAHVSSTFVTLEMRAAHTQTCLAHCRQMKLRAYARTQELRQQRREHAYSKTAGVQPPPAVPSSASSATGMWFILWSFCACSSKTKGASATPGRDTSLHTTP